MALENAVVENEVDEVVFFADENALLTGLEAKAVAELEEEVVQVIEEGCFEIGFLNREVTGEAEKLESVEVFGVQTMSAESWQGPCFRLR